MDFFSGVKSGLAVFSTAGEFLATFVGTKVAPDIVEPIKKTGAMNVETIPAGLEVQRISYARDSMATETGQRPVLRLPEPRDPPGSRTGPSSPEKQPSVHH